MISSKEIAEAYRLALFEECMGPLKKLTEHDGILNVLIGKVHLILPATMGKGLRLLIGQRIAILRTDLPHREYIFRVLAGEPEQAEGDEIGG